MEKLKPGRNNQEDRMNFVEFWAKYVKTHPDEVWSKQQKMIIDSQIINTKNFKLSAKEYLKIKKEDFR
ncbi:hypothetical protein HYX16_05650 [Candidatus Woesearchaeota archaeon]|nr:hypothetical protein [Candidatus Woesearchaeota archaeon]